MTMKGTGAAQPSSVKPPPFLDELYTLYGRDTQDRGTLLTAGGIREVTPSVGTEASSAHNLFKRLSWEISVDGPSKRKSGSLEDYVRDLSKTVATRSQKRVNREEMVRAMQLMEEDGLQERSPLYCQALYLCTRNPDYRTAFMQMKTKEGRLNWIQFNWDMLNK
ncbi:hypothetical protein SETIT_7G221000v2 [Setaria italica]|uniref:Uncharacterized protein n=1 Tax=Setaria italica TaxID=4555 RepID=A0A368RYN0_SETIT|nr:hypothetical protein SETIT_7G221000v2 [Setaria italica]